MPGPYDELAFNEGKTYLQRNAFEGSTVFFELSARKVGMIPAGAGEYSALDTLLGGYGGIGGTGYAPVTKTVPADVDGIISFAQFDFAPSDVDWPVAVRSLVMRSATAIIHAWNLNAGGGADDLSVAGRVERVTPVFFYKNVGE